MTVILKKRHRRERWFRRMGLLSLLLSLLFLGSVFGDILYKGYPAFFRTEIAVETGQQDFFNPFAAYQLKKRIAWVPAADDVDMYTKHGLSGKLSSQQIQVLESLKKKGQLRLVLNTQFFTHSDSREPELAGIWGGLVGSILTLVVTFLAAFPLGVGAALYLEEFAPKKRWVYWVEANINNLAAVPSILFGLLGLVFFIRFMGLPRPSALVGGLTLGIMSLPVIIVATRAALLSVPSSLKEAALGLGATPLQVIFHHVIPKALPGIMTGVILSLARALGETAPLLMVGMVAFIGKPPTSIVDPTTVLPVQIFNWSRSPEMGFIENTSGAILVLLFVLALFNGVALFVRRRFET